MSDTMRMAGRAELRPGQEIRFTITYTWWARICMLFGWNVQPMTIIVISTNEINVTCEELVRE